MKERHKERPSKDPSPSKNPTKDPKQVERDPQRRKERWEKGATDDAERRRGQESDAREPGKRTPSGE